MTISLHGISIGITLQHATTLFTLQGITKTLLKLGLTCIKHISNNVKHPVLCRAYNVFYIIPNLLHNRRDYLVLIMYLASLRPFSSYNIHFT